MKKLLVFLLTFTLVFSPLITSVQAQTSDAKSGSEGTTDIISNPSIETSSEATSKHESNTEPETMFQLSDQNDNSSDITDSDEVDRSKEVDGIIDDEVVPSSIAQNDGYRDNTQDVVGGQHLELEPLTGALHFEHSITLPPGRNSLTPDIKLMYSSQPSDQTNSYGYGWSDNIPYIQRINKKGTEKLYSENFFYSSIDGELKANDTSASSTSYGAKVDNGNFRTYQYVNNNTWLITDKSGIIYKFGYSSSTQQYDPNNTSKIYKWMLEEVRDQNNNFIRYEYTKDSNQIYPSKIFYTGNDNTDGIFEVAFTRETRPDNATSSKSAFQIVSKYRINEIQAKINGTWVKKYVLAYTAGSNGTKSLLSSITESGQDESSNVLTLPPTKFNYQTDTAAKGWMNTGLVLPDSFVTQSKRDNGARLVEFNGDGLVDFIKSLIITTGYDNATYISTTTGWTASSTWISPGPITDTNGKARDMTWVDFNGDGRTDVYRCENVNTQNTHTYINNSHGWTIDDAWNYGDCVITLDPPGRDAGVRVVDVNGDGLPDIVSSTIYFNQNLNSIATSTGAHTNNGHGFTRNDETWGPPTPYIDTMQNNMDLGVRMADVNGDGLIDFISAKNFLERKVYLNNGNGWTHDPSWTVPVYFVGNTGLEVGARFSDVNGDGLADILFGSGSLLSQTTYINNGHGWTEDGYWAPPGYFENGVSEDNGWRFGDINGDGMDDISLGQGDTKTVSVNKTKRVDMLTNIVSSSGATSTITYKASAQYQNSLGNFLNPQLPHNIDTVQKIEIFDGMATSTNEYVYEGGLYYFADAFDRQPAGFHSITRIDSSGTSVKTFYHQGDSTDSDLGEYSDHFSKIGKPYREEITDILGNTYSKNVNKWENQALTNGRQFVALARITHMTYDGDGTHKDKASTFAYASSTGNLTQKINLGEVTASNDGTFSDTGTDDFTTNIAYATGATSTVTGLPSTETTIDHNANHVSEIRHYFDTLSLGSINKGNETGTEKWKSGFSYVNTQKAYNNHGLVIQETNPRSKQTLYNYDSYNLYPATSTNALSQSTQYTYDYSLGKPKQIIDVNNRVFQTVYDALDRVKEEKQPDIASPSTLVTKTLYTYVDTGLPKSVQQTNYLGSATSSDIYTFFDGLGRIVQERKEAEGSNYAVKDTAYNNLGLKSAESLPYFSTGSTLTTATTAAALYTTYNYDPLKRITTVANAVGTTTNTYDDWKTTITDARSVSKDLYSDAYSNLIKVDEHNATSTYSTLYEYSGLGNLTKITDALSNIRNFTYDGLGRRLNAQDLHASADATFGSTTYAYDDAGNISQIIDAKNQTTNYTYDDINRPLTEDYTGVGGTEVAYLYDTCTNGKGRLCTATSTDAVTHYTYNALGLTASETKTINSINYVSSYLYDRLGNQTLVTYPDNSQVQYAHNSAGLLETIKQKESGAGSFAPVINDFDYSPTGTVSYKEFANGISSSYTYDPANLYRLTRILTSATTTGMGGDGEGLGYMDIPGFKLSDEFNPLTTRLLALLDPEVESDASAKETQETETVTEPTEKIVSEEATTTEIGEEVLEEVEKETLDVIVEVPVGDSVVTEISTTTSVSATSTPELATSTEEVMKEPIVSVVKTKGKGLVKNREEAKAWRKYHKERVEYLKSEGNLPPRILEAALHGQTQFEDYLKREKYISNPGDEIRAPGISAHISTFFKGLLGFVLPKTAYAFIFGKEDFETCSSLPCSFDSNASWGNIAVSIDHGSKISGEDSLKAVVTGEGGGSLRKGGLSRSEVWVQFKVWVPNPVTWGTSSYFGLLMLEDGSTNDTLWINVEDYGTPRLTVAGDVLGYTNTGIDLIEGAVNTIEIRAKIGSSNGDIDIWHNSSTQGSPTYNGSGSMNTGTDNIDAVLAGLQYAPEGGVSTTYYDDIIIDSSFIGTSTSIPDFADPIQDIRYTYDAVGNITQITDYSDTGTGKVVAFGYDDLSRLTSASTTAASSTPYTQTYSYSAIGNITSKSDVGSYTYAGTNYANPHAATSIAGTGLVYDNNGNVTDDGLFDHTWNYRNQLIESGNGAATSTYGYDHNGDRVKLTEEGFTTYFPNKLYNTSGSNGTTTKHIYAGDLMVASVEFATTTVPDETQVVGRALFYNNSPLDGDTSGPDEADDAAIAGNKSALLPGGTGSFTNISTYSKGINGVMIDVENLVNTSLSTSDFTFSVGNNNTPGGWTSAPSPTSISVRAGDGVDGSDRITIIWNDEEIVNTWLRVALASTTDTGLASPDIFYFGSQLGDADGDLSVDNDDVAKFETSFPFNVAGEEESGQPVYSDSFSVYVGNGNTFDITGSVDTVGLIIGSSDSVEWYYEELYIPPSGAYGMPNSGISSSDVGSYVSNGWAGIKLFAGDNATSNMDVTVSGITARDEEVTGGFSDGDFNLSGTLDGTDVSSVTNNLGTYINLITPSETAGIQGMAVATTTVRYIHTDHLGGSSVVTDGSGNIAEAVDYYPYGEVRLDTKGGSYGGERRKFTGYESDSATGLNYAGARYQDPRVGRFMSVDPAFLDVGDRPGFEQSYGIKTEQFLSDPQLLNSYSYARNNPLVHTDKSGKILDTIVDVGFISYDLYSLGKAYYNGENTKGHWASLGLDVAGFFIPFATGLGHLDDVSKAGKAFNRAENVVNGGNDYVRFVEGVRVDHFGKEIRGTVDLKPTLDRIQSGEKFPHRNDGSIYQNREGFLPKQSDGYYREYVHPTPGQSGPGSQRIIQGKGGETYYSSDHYKSQPTRIDIKKK